MAETEHDAECPEGPHAHLPGGVVMEFAAIGGMAQASSVVNQRLSQKSEYGDPFMRGMFVLAKIAVASIDGGEGHDPTARLYWELAEASGANDMPRMFKAVTDLFVVLAAKQGAPPNPAEAMAEMLAIAAEISDLVETLRETIKERAEGAGDDNGS